jgi:hypothetical protein
VFSPKYQVQKHLRGVAGIPLHPFALRDSPRSEPMVSPSPGHLADFTKRGFRLSHAHSRSLLGAVGTDLWAASDPSPWLHTVQTEPEALNG